MIDVVVCIPTFRRPEMLAATLDSLVAQTFGRPFALVVVDNDAAGRAGLAMAQSYFDAEKLSGRALVEPSQGNVHAINTAFATALEAYPNARYVLMLDDDEIASPQWLEQMVATAEETGAGIVGGPVMPYLEGDARPGLSRHPAFVPAYSQSGPVPMIYGSGNCLITRDTFGRLGLPAFDVAYNFLGGGDTDFFTRARRAGIRAHWSEEALITETVPLARQTPRWLVARGLRCGVVNHRIERKHAAGFVGRLKIAAKSVAILGLSGLRAARLLVMTREPMIALHPVLVALGRFVDAFGLEPQQYKAANAK